MEQHPVPQHVSSYQFKLVGDMTLKQFFQLAGGALISLIIYASGLNPIIKWPLVLFFSILGAALAFLPFQDRPLEKWFLAFFKSIYSPTLFHWEKTKGGIFFQQEDAPAVPLQNEKIIAPGGTPALNSYLSEVPQQRLSFFTKLEGSEKSFLSKTLELFGAGEIKFSQKFSPQVPPLPMFYQGVGSKTPSIQRPQIPIQKPSTTQLYQVAPNQGQKTFEGAAAQFSLQAAPPNPPTMPNLITGQVMDSEGKIIEAAIMEIKDSVGQPVRALKTNKLGHFIIVTPLINGKYEIITEKEGHVFAPVTFEARGEIIPPIAIRAKQQTNNQQSTTIINHEDSIS